VIQGKQADEPFVYKNLVYKPIYEKFYYFFSTKENQIIYLSDKHGNSLYENDRNALNALNKSDSSENNGNNDDMGIFKKRKFFFDIDF
jgi:hypothetical protein